MHRIALTIAALAGIVSGQMILAFRTGMAKGSGKTDGSGNTTGLVPDRNGRGGKEGQGDAAPSGGTRDAAPHYPDRGREIMASIMHQNMVMIQNLIAVQDRFLKEMVFEADETKHLGLVAHEIHCRTDHIEILRKFLDDDAERIIKDTAAWAHEVLADYNLKLEAVTLEPDASVEEDREHDAVLTFVVTGDGHDALRFQAAASRKLRDLVFNGGRSGEALRVDVKWK